MENSKNIQMPKISLNNVSHNIKHKESNFWATEQIKHGFKTHNIRNQTHKNEAQQN